MYQNKWSAISELVANGLDAGATNIKVYINVIDKKKSTIEIIDNGTGMSYDDLHDKYALIGRNKRETEEDIRKDVKGRKGIGKLAALYLSKKYYIITKYNGNESVWMLDSNNAKDSDLPKLDKVKTASIVVDNKDIWDTYTHGTVLKMTDVDMSYFGETKLNELKSKIADYYLLESLSSNIEVAYITGQEEMKDISRFYVKAKKRTAFKNFYAFFETEDKLKSQELGKEVYIRKQKLSEVNTLKEVITLRPSDVSETFECVGEDSFINLEGKEEILSYEMRGWIGIHSTINQTDARELNDERFSLKSKKLKLYIRDKLAVENFIDYIGSNQALVNNIEGEISFDILDDDRLPDISTTSREGLAVDDKRVSTLVDIVKKIITKLISERVKIGNLITTEERRVEEEEKEKIRQRELAEQEAKEREREARERAEQERVEAEKKRKEAEEESEKLKKANDSLEKQNKIKDIVLSGNDSEKQTLLVHELTGISNQIDYVVEDLAEDFMKTDEFERIQDYLKDLKKSSNKLSTIKKQFLKLNDYDIIGKQDIDLKKYLKSYFQNIMTSRVNMRIIIGENSYISKVEIFELGILLDNIIINSIERNAQNIEIVFKDGAKEFHIISDTGPITINPIDDIFKLGISSKENGTGIGMYLCREISNSFGWEISVENRDNLVDFTIHLED